MAKRTPRQQTKHDKAVRKTAQYYQSQGYKTTADIENFNQPKTIKGRRADVIAKKDNKTIIVEVETPDSIQRDRGQQKIFQNYADTHKNVKFRTKVAK